MQLRSRSQTPGVEFEDGSQNLQFRVGAGYEFEVVPSWAIVPEFNVEFVDGPRPPPLR